MRPLEAHDPRTAGPYRIVARIAAGGMATVYFGQSPAGRAVAVKVMHPELAADAHLRERFRREADATWAAGGRYSPALLAAGTADPVPWLALEYLPGISLREAVRLAGPLPVDSLRWLAAGLVEALQSIHAAGLIHLDLNPANVLLTPDGLRLIDFGIVAVDGRVPLSVAGAPGFMAPEQITGGVVGPAADVYALGATLAYAGTGVPEIVERCLNPDPAARPTVAELAAMGTAPVALPPAVLAEIELRTAEAANPPVPVAPARRRRRMACALVALVLLAAGGVWAVSVRDRQAPATTHSRSASPRPTARVLTISFAGNTTLNQLTYTVNGRATTLAHVALPWSVSVAVPLLPPKTSWRLDYAFDQGEIGYEVRVDGLVVYSGGTGGYGHEVHDNPHGET